MEPEIKEKRVEKISDSLKQSIVSFSHSQLNESVSLFQPNNLE